MSVPRVPFARIYEAALLHHGAAVEDDLPPVRSPEELAAIPDDRWLSVICRRVFEAGFVWRVVAAKWPGFEAVFFGFDPVPLALLPADEILRLGRDPRAMYNETKLLAIGPNATFVLDRRESHGGFGAWIAAWPASDPVGLWQAMARDGARLGGASASYVLRRMGRDTFLLTDEVVRALLRSGAIDRPPGGLRDRRAIQDFFRAWQQETGRPFAELSRIAARSLGP